MLLHCVYTLDELKMRLAFWQRALRLQDWDIDISIRRMAEFELRGVGGELHTYVRQKRALIYVLHPDDFASLNPPSLNPHDMEYTLVHELMHLSIHACTKAYEPNSPEETAEEQCVHALALAFVGFVRPTLPLPLNLIPYDTGKTTFPFDPLCPNTARPTEYIRPENTCEAGHTS